MGEKEKVALSEAEFVVLQALWSGGPATVRVLSERLRGRGRNWAYTTVLTLLQRLVAKGWVKSDTSSAAYVFRAGASRDEWLGQQLQTLADRACEGAPGPLVLALVNKGRFTGREIKAFRKLLDEYENGGGGRGTFNE
jgi:predicted transcriptional regulator